MEKNIWPYITTEQMVIVDQLMIEDFGIQLIQMMENAGRHLASLGRKRFLKGDPTGTRITVLAGSGGNGGGAMVAARHLHNWGADVRVGLTRSVSTLKETIKIQAKILREMGIPLGIFGEIDLHNQPYLILDGIIGYSIQGPPRGLAADMITWANEQSTHILALDLPSGLHGTTGEVMEPAIRASATMTLALPKIGLQKAKENIVGELYLADIGVPPALYTRSPLNLNVGTIFNLDPILRIK